MKNTPVKINALGDLTQNNGFNINPEAVSYMGSSTATSNYSKGSIINETVLDKLCDSTNIAYSRVDQTIYNNMTQIGNNIIPALGNSKPDSYTLAYANDLKRYGWLRLIPLQAYQELYLRNGSYSDFCYTLNVCYSYKKSMNELLASSVNSKTYLDGVYSNMNDLTTADITGITLSTFYWGQDLIKTGKVIDLTTIDTFGEPVNLLRVLNKNKALTKSVSLALLSTGLSINDVTSFSEGQQPTVDQQRLMYGAFSIIAGSDLTDVLTILNCQTQGLNTLADLLYVKKLFPNSYATLTFPRFNAIPQPTNSKTYYPMFRGTAPSFTFSPEIGQRLINLVPAELAYTSDAFSITMMNVKNIKTMNIEKFSQVVTNLENMSGLRSLDDGSKPTNTQMASNILNTWAKGTEPENLFNMCDFFGSMTFLHYKWTELQNLIEKLQTPALVSIYQQIYNILIVPDPFFNPSPLPGLINQANQEILNIKTNQPVLSEQLNDLYEQFGTYLLKEKNARDLALVGFSDSPVTDANLITFMNCIESYAIDTPLKQTAPVIENICNLDTIGGNNIIAAMREARNSKRLGLTGAVQDNNVNDTASISNTNASGNDLKLPRPTGYTLQQLPIQGYDNTTKLSNIPIITGAATVPGSFAGSPETMLIPDSLSILVQPNGQSVLNPTEAIDTVILCNCDCWENL